jgi:ABC-2 type transport system permease protein
MLTLLTQSVSNASFGIYFPKLHGHDLRAAVGTDVAAGDRARLCRRGGHQVDHARSHHAGDGGCSCRFQIAHPLWMLAFLVLTSVTFSLLGFIIGIWADGFEKLQIVPLLIITPLTFLGGTFYSISVLPPPGRIALFNPVVYLVSGFRWSFYEVADVSVAVSLSITLAFLLLCLGIVAWIFKTGYRLRKLRLHVPATLEAAGDCSALRP